MSLGSPYDYVAYRMKAERDEARAEIERLRAELAQAQHWRRSYAEAVKDAEAENVILRDLLLRASHDVRYSAVKGDNDSAALLAEIEAVITRNP